MFVHEIKVPRRCMSYACSKTSKYAFGNGSPGTWHYVCEDCLRKIVEEGSAILGNDKPPHAGDAPLEFEKESEHIRLHNAMNAEAPAESPDVSVQPIKDENGKQYACKKCGEEFTDVNEYRTHCLQAHRGEKK